MNSILEEIKQLLKSDFDIDTKIDNSSFLISEFDGYAKEYNSFYKMEELAISICKYLNNVYGEFLDITYELIGNTGQYDIRLEVIEFMSD